MLDSNSQKLLLKISFQSFFTAARLAQSVARLTADRKVSGSIPKANTKGLQITENKGAAYLALQTARHLRGSDDHMR